MNPRIVFVVMSAVSKPGTIDQLARALAPHLVLVHHDFSQTPDFSLTAPNAQFVPNPKRTGWAVFGLVEGMFYSMQHALAHCDFDYLQLLSPTCMPIKPLCQFEEHICGPAQAHFGCIDLMNDREALMSVGYRAFTPERSIRHRVARRLSNAYFATASGRRDEAGVWLRSGGGKGLVSWIAAGTINALSRKSIGRHIFDEAFRPYYGSAWFGARRHVIEGMVESFSRPDLHDYFSRLRIAEEYVIPTLLKHLGPVQGAMNHYVHKFVEAHTGQIGEENFELLRTSPAYFARKFADDPAAALRTRVLRELVGIEPDGGSIAERPAVRRRAGASSATQGERPGIPDHAAAGSLTAAGASGRP